MKRLCIYMTYNKECKIYEYMGELLNSLKVLCSKVYLVCNFKKIRSGYEYVTYTDKVFYRSNLGYDSGAYKDIICNYLGWEEVRKYDELLLVNDSFFGFFYPLSDSFKLMDKVDCDFWGMTGQEAGEYRNPYLPFDAHIHSYFMVFKKNVVKSGAFKSFWEELTYPVTFREAIVKFELGINNYLKSHGFKGVSYIDIFRLHLKRNENPYYSYLYDLVCHYKVPIMKKKCILVRNIGFSNTLKTIRYLEKEKLYPIEWIKSYLENQFYILGMGDGPCNSLEIFYRNYSSIYIYGAGVCGKNLALYFEYKGWEFKNFVVTDKVTADIQTMNIMDIEINRNTGIIIAVIDEKAAKEIEESIGERCTKKQLFFLWNCRAIRLPV